MNLIRWRNRSNVPSTTRSDPESLFGTLWDRLPEMDLASHLPEAFRRGPVPALNVAETETDVTVTVELPGMDEEDIRVDVMGNVLTVSGERRWESESKDKRDYTRIESQYGSFERSVTLPAGLRTDPESIVATYKKGMLTVTIPKVEPTPSTQIRVRPE